MCRSLRELSNESISFQIDPNSNEYTSILFTCKIWLRCSRSASNVSVFINLFVPLRYLQFLRTVRFTSQLASQPVCQPASQSRTSLVKFARSPCTDRPVRIIIIILIITDRPGESNLRRIEESGCRIGAGLKIRRRGLQESCGSDVLSRK